MEDTYIRDLTIRLGYPYVYVHQVSDISNLWKIKDLHINVLLNHKVFCTVINIFSLQGQHEHLFTFTDARLLSVDDPQRVSDYPFERSVGTQHSRFCMICDVHISKWVTEDNERVPEDPFFFCDTCFRGFNYDERGEKIGSFRAYPYVDVNAL